ncbi:MAG TPA: hypothetical protein VMC78_17605 [Mycobacterium sp.]|nr:hypothetical protein [Mycobacterium sp.]
MADPGASPAERLRSPASRLLLAAALTSTLVLGAGSLAAGRRHSSNADSVAGAGHTATDEQTKAEVVEHAKQIVAVAALQNPTGGYLLMSCKNREDPPYQGAVYIDFALPADAHGNTYFQGIARALVARGWREGLPPNQHVFGTTLSKDGVTASIYPDNASPAHGVARIHGQCHDMNNHRGESSAWVDITDQLH